MTRIVSRILLTADSSPNHNKKMLASGATATISDKEIDDDGHDDDFNESVWIVLKKNPAKSQTVSDSAKTP